MAPARPLRDVFNELTGSAAGGADPQAVLAAAGHPDLPEGLVAEAIVNYADTAPAEVAEHLAPFVTAHGALPVQPEDTAAAEPASWLDVLASAPDVLDADPAVDATGAPVPGEDASDDGLPEHDPFTLDFGEGVGGAVDSIDDGALDFGDGATGAGADPGTGGQDPVANGALGHPYPQPSFDDLAALDGLGGPDQLDTGEPLDTGVGAPGDRDDHDAAGPDTVDDDRAGDG
jgi:hypothetical protein